MNHDKAAIAQLRGWAYRVKRNQRTPMAAGQGIQCAVADDVRAYPLPGFDVQVKRDGAVVYQRDGKTVMLDRGERIEMVDDSKPGIMTACWLASQKSEETLMLRGAPSFMQNVLSVLPEFNQRNGRQFPLTHPAQRQAAGYDMPHQAQPAPDVRPEDVPRPRPKGPTFTP